MKSFLYICILIVISQCFFQIADAADGTDSILELLVKKGIITEDESLKLKQKDSTDTQGPQSAISSKPVSKIAIGGKVEMRYEDSEGEEGTFKMKLFEPFVQIDFNDNISLKGQLECTTDSAKVNEAWIQYKDLPGVGGGLKAGKIRRKSFGLYQGGSARISCDYSLLARAFTGERQVGIEYFRRFDNAGFMGTVDLSLGMFNGGDIGTREAGDNADTPVLFMAERAGDVDDNQAKEGTVRFATQPCKELKIGISALIGKLSSNDLAAVNAALATSYTDDSKQRYGGDISYVFGAFPLELRAEYIFAETGELESDSWYLMVISRLADNKLDLYTRYSQLNLDIDVSPDSQTWDLQQLTLGVVWHLAGTSQLQLEYDLNTEDLPSGTDSVNNNIIRLEWQTTF
ncbi:hypothetical protein ACFL6F_02075 [Planctomycetota bacterium]